MGFRFRKSIKIAPGVKLNLNKKSAGITVGTRGIHYTVNTKGKKTSTVGLPGTGLSYTTSSGGGSSNAVQKQPTNNNQEATDSSIHNTDANNKKKKHGCLIPVLIVIILGIIGSFMSGDNLKSIELSSDTSTIYDINEKVTINSETDPENYKISKDKYFCSGGNVKIEHGNITFTAQSEGTYDVYIKSDSIKSNVLTFTFEDKTAKEAELKKIQEEQAKAEAEKIAQAQAEAAAQAQAEAEAAAQAQAEAAAQAQAEAEAQAQAAAAAQTQPQEQMVWIAGSGNGAKYHSRSGCSNMSSPLQITISDAQSRGYGPCKKCH